MNADYIPAIMATIAVSSIIILKMILVYKLNKKRKKLK